MATKNRNRALEAVHETAADLHRLGFIDKHQMQRIDALWRSVKNSPCPSSKPLDSLERKGREVVL